MSRRDDHNYSNAAMGQQFRVYVGFGSEIRMAVDAAMRTPPPTIYPERVGLVPGRPTALMGPHRLGFVGEGVPFYGGYSHSRWRRAAMNHSWAGTGNPTISVADDPEPQYPINPQPAYALFTWATPGIYEAHLTVSDDNGKTHSARRQVIIYASRDSAYDGVTQVSGLTGSNTSGWSCTLTVKGDTSFILAARQLDGYLPVVIYADFFYETRYGVWERRALGPNWRAGDYRDDPRIIFSGYIQKESIRVAYDTSTVTFVARTADMILEQLQSGTYGFFDHPSNGSGIIFNDLQTHDVLRHMVQEHSSFADWHDLRFVQDATDMGFYPSLEYKDWTWNQGVYWANIVDTAANQFEHAYVSNHGELFVTYDRNMWQPNMYERTFPMGTIDARQVRMGPENGPISVITASPIPDCDYVIPLGEIAIEGRMAQGVSYYKIIGSLSFSNEEWGADYPRGAPRAASGRWVLDSGRYLSDDFRQQFWDEIFWQWACRGYAAANARYDLSVTLPMHTYWRIQDIVEIRFHDPQGRVSFGVSVPPTNYFEVTTIAYDINSEAGRWVTTYILRELTVYTAPTPDIPAIPGIGKGTSA